jgi:hypothetical protein
MMDLSQRKEQFSRVFCRAIATVARFTVYQPEVDDDSVDLGIAGRIAYEMPRPPRIELQLKCTARPSDKAEEIAYRLELKNYDDLRQLDLVVPKILVVVLVPRNESEWLTQSEDELILRRCAYWTSLRGRDETKNLGKVTIRLPRSNLFSVEGLRDLMKRAARKEAL